MKLNPKQYFQKGTLDVLAKKANCNDLQKELCHFSRSYITSQPNHFLKVYLTNLLTKYHIVALKQSKMNFKYNNLVNMALLAMLITTKTFKFLTHLTLIIQKYNLHFVAYSNLYLLYKYVLTLAFTSTNCERGFSKMKIIQTR